MPTGNNPNPRWAENFNRTIVVPCKSDWCDNYIRTTKAGANGGVYCPSCREEAHKLSYKARTRAQRLARNARDRENYRKKKELEKS